MGLWVSGRHSGDRGVAVLAHHPKTQNQTDYLGERPVQGCRRKWVVEMEAG
jgi:hypothetical protein